MNIETRARLIPVDGAPPRSPPWGALLAWGAGCVMLGVMVGRVWG